MGGTLLLTYPTSELEFPPSEQGDLFSRRLGQLTSAGSVPPQGETVGTTLD
jgi:hypothetical protein